MEVVALGCAIERSSAQRTNERTDDDGRNGRVWKSSVWRDNLACLFLCTTYSTSAHPTRFFIGAAAAATAVVLQFYRLYSRNRYSMMTMTMILCGARGRGRRTRRRASASPPPSTTRGGTFTTSEILFFFLAIRFHLLLLLQRNFHYLPRIFM